LNIGEQRIGRIVTGVEIVRNAFVGVLDIKEGNIVQQEKVGLVGDYGCRRESAAVLSHQVKTRSSVEASNCKNVSRISEERKEKHEDVHAHNDDNFGDKLDLFQTRT